VDPLFIARSFEQQFNLSSTGSNKLLIIQFVYLNKQEDESVWRTCQQIVDSQWNQPFP